jgi:hypothetical protein
VAVVHVLFGSAVIKPFRDGLEGVGRVSKVVSVIVTFVSTCLGRRGQCLESCQESAVLVDRWHPFLQAGRYKEVQIGEMT